MKRLGLFFLASLMLGPSAMAFTILKVVKSQALISLDGGEAEVGEVFKILDGSGNKVGMFKITKLAGEKAQGKFKGKAEKGFKLELAKKSKTRDTEESASAGSSSGGTTAFGLLIGMEMSSWAIDSGGSQTTLKGNNISVGGFYDLGLKFFSVIGLRIGGGLFMLNLTEDGTSCKAKNTPAEACFMKVNYLTLGGAARYVFAEGGFRPWVGLGSTLYVPMTKDIVQVYDTSQGTDQNYITVPAVTFAPGFQLGADVHFGKMFIPIVFEYSLFAKTATVSPSMTSLRIGIGF